jgi:serine/threonine protein kinase
MKRLDPALCAVCAMRRFLAKFRAAMTQLSANEATERIAGAGRVPLSERPLVADDENTVISSPEQPRADTKQEVAAATSTGDEIRNRLFPSNGVLKGEEVGVRLAHFEITGRLGSGGMGAVFKATDLELARDVALKVLHPASAQDPSLIARFRNEARACAQLNHDNIARVYYADSQEGMYFIAYEYASGRTIRDLIVERGRLSAADTINYAIQVTLALNHTAAAGIVHRDIKPSNIMLTNSGRVKVVDLGLARRETTDSIGDITVAGTTLGTFDYIAPEQARDPRNADQRSDIYSLGCTMYHMLTGRPPYPEGTALQKLLDHQGKSAPDPRTLNSSIPEEIAAIMRKMMANEPEARYQAPGLLLNDLIQMAQILGLQSVPAEGIVWRKLGPAGTRQPLGAVWVFVSVLLICVTAVFLHSAPRTELVADNGEFDDGNLGTPVNQLDSVKGGPEFGSPSGSAHASPEANPAVAPTVSPRTGIPPETVPAVVSGDSLPTPFPVIPPAESLLFPIVSPFNSSVVRMGLSRQQAPIPDVNNSKEMSGPFVLQRSSGTTDSFRTLKAAIADARSGDAVLLRYNGYPDDLPTQRPVRVFGMDLIIRAADGYRPTLVFDGDPEGTVSPGQIISLRGNGKLTLLDLDLRVVARDDLSADRWSLFHCTGPNKIELTNVSIDFRNSDGQPAALFDLAGEASGPDADGAGETEISLNRVICRADADGFQIASQVRGRIELKDCGVALKGSLINNRGDTSMAPMRGAVDVLLNHVTCITSAPMLSMDDTDSLRPGNLQRLMPRLSVSSEACVFAAQGTDRRLMLTDGTSVVEDLETLVSWNGFNNLYDGFEIYWQIDSPALDYAPRRRNFAEWIRNWDDRMDSEETNADVLPESAWQNDGWKGSASDRWLLDLTPSSFELNPAIFMPGVPNLQKARDGRVPGVNSTELPPFPQHAPATVNPSNDATPGPLAEPATAANSSASGSTVPDLSRVPDVAPPTSDNDSGVAPPSGSAPLVQKAKPDFPDE